MASAQLVNGSFEEGLNAWEPTPWVSSLVADAAPDQGTTCLQISSEQWFPATVFQPLPGLVQGEIIRFGGWIKSVNSWFQEQPRMAICICTNAGVLQPLEPSLASTAPQWAFLEDTIDLTSPLPPGTSYGICVSGSIHAASTVFDARFDGIFIEPVIALGTTSPDTHPAIGAYPNPAMDQLRIDLPGTAISILAIEASGRTHELKNFTHRDRTLEVDVNALPVGICLLRITTASGTHAVRFVKA